MVEESDSGESHGDAIFVAGSNHMVVTHTAAGLCDELDTAAVSAFDVVASGTGYAPRCCTRAARPACRVCAAT